MELSCLCLRIVWDSQERQAGREVNASELDMEGAEGDLGQFKILKIDHEYFSRTI